MRFWRDHVLEHAGDHIDALKDHVKDQAKFAERCEEIIADLGLPAEFEDPMEDTDQDDIETIDESDESESEFSPEDVVLDDEAMAEEESRAKRP